MPEKNHAFASVGYAVVVAGLLFLVLSLSGPGYQPTAAATLQVCVPGPHAGTITGTQTWCLADSPHALTSDVIVPAGVTLTVEAGVTVQGADHQALLVEGSLVAEGTAVSPITFTSSLDTGGSQWGGIGFDTGSTGSMRYTTVRYAGRRNDVSDAFVPGNPYYVSAVTIIGGELHLENVTLRDITGDYDHGLLIDDSTVVMTDTLVTGIGNGGQQDAAMRVSGADTVLTMSGCRFTGNTRDRVLLMPDAMMGHDATLSAQPVLEGYELPDTFIVPPTVTLTVEAGVTVQGADHQALLVEGSLVAEGTAVSPITFTSSLDTGGSQWGGIGFDIGSAGSMRYTTVRYAGRRNDVSDAFVPGNPYYVGAVTIIGGELHLENVTLRDVTGDYDHGLLIDDSTVVMTDTLVTGIGNGGQQDAAMRVKGPDTVLTMSGCRFTGNTRDRVLLMPDAMMGHDTTLTAQPVLEGYEFRETYTVPPTYTLTLEPGVTLMGANGKALVVAGELEALGTIVQPITFTSASDSGSGQWAGLAFDGGTGHLRHATVRYAGDRNAVTDALVGPHDHSNLAARNGTLHLENVTVRDIATGDYDYGLIAGDSHLVISDTLFTAIGNGDSRDVAMRLQGPDAALEMSGCTFTGNTLDRVWLEPGAMMGRDVTLAAQPALEAYQITGDFTVPPTVTLSLEPGVTMMAAGNLELLVAGHLDAVGTAAKPITFTSAANTGAAQWSGLVFDGSQGAGTGYLRHATVRYGGHGNSVLAASGDYHSGSNVTVNGVLTGEVRLEHVTLASEYHWDGWHAFGDHGLYINDSQVVVSDSIIEDNCDGGSDDSGVYVRGDSTVWIEDSLVQSNDAPGLVVAGDEAFVNVRSSSIVNNDGDGVRSEGAATVILSGDAASGNAIHDNTGFGAHQAGTSGQTVATHNWWGAASGPTHAGNPSGTGEAVTDRVLYDPWLMAAPTPPAVATQLVQATGPLNVSPGDAVNLGIFVDNLLTETLTGTVAVMQLSDDTEYLMSTGGGAYWPSRHQVVWQLGNTTPRTTWKEAIRIRPVWGLAIHHKIGTVALVAAENRPNPSITISEYQAYTELGVVTTDAVTDPELAALRAAHSDLDALYQDAADRGFLYYGSAQMEHLSDGTDRLALVLLNTTKPGERIDLYHDDDGAVAIHTTPLCEEIYGLTGGMRFYFDTGEVDAWGDMERAALTRFPLLAPCAADGCEDFGYNDCLRNCMIRTIPTGQFASHYSSKCATCYASGEQCQQCAWHMQLMRNETIKNSLDACYAYCDESVDDQKCTGPTRDCVTSHQYIETPCIDCEYATEYNTWGVCKADERCINGACRPIDDDDNDEHDLEILAASDPNAMYGPSVVTPGQWMTYTIAYENVGVGNAHGVYVISHLPPELDATTLQVADGGTYLSGSRTLIWDVGMLGPGEGGEVHIRVQVPSTVPSDTVIVAGGTVHFPSVPETTPTNDVVTIVGDVVAYAQQVATVEGTPVAITLGGSSPTGHPLNYVIDREPFGGDLSGSAPHLTYTPAGNFEGLDSFAFHVEDGVNASGPAEVTIQVATGAETTPPEVLLTVPGDGATGVHVYETAILTDTYHPVIWAAFSEPLDGTTLTTATFSMVKPGGGPLAGTVELDTTTNRAFFSLDEPLARNATYTATLTTGVHDSSGNPMAADYVWRFYTEADNQPPVADAGADQEVSAGVVVTLDGSGSSDSDGNLPLVYRWTQEGGPAITLTNTARVTATFTAPPEAAVLTFTLAVTDSLGLAGAIPDQVVVTVLGAEDYRTYLPLAVRD